MAIRRFIGDFSGFARRMMLDSKESNGYYLIGPPDLYRTVIALFKASAKFAGQKKRTQQDDLKVPKVSNRQCVAI